MFKLTGSSGYRRSGGGGYKSGPRVISTRMGSVHQIIFPMAPAFSPDTPQERTFDSDSPRLQGLEAATK